ncbi:MAG: FAD-dependent oxidoreductase, partial [Bryobacteraceae bacterium]
RVSEPKNYGLAETPGRTVLCAEWPCSTRDAAWTSADAELGRLVVEGLARAGLPVHAPVLRVAVRRLEHAYPLYLRDYRASFDRLDAWASSVAGLLSFGRQGLFAHDNTHHTLAMAYAAARAIRDDATIDRAQWAAGRRSFESHVVED